MASDATRDALNRMEQDGFDLSKHMDVEFVIVSPSKDKGQALMKKMAKMGFTCEIEFDDTQNDWLCYCSEELIPSYENITQIEKQLTEIANAFDSGYEGFGSFGNN